jgi:hypothetical protein
MLRVAEGYIRFDRLLNVHGTLKRDNQVLKNQNMKKMQEVNLRFAN